MTASRKSPRSRRAVGATGLLIAAVLVVTAGIMVSSIPVLVAATVYAVVSGVVAARLLSNEIAQMRRDRARDRAVVADEHRRTALARSAEHLAFADQMGSRMRMLDSHVSTLRDSLLTAEIDLALARERVSAEAARSLALQADVDSAQSDLDSARVDLNSARDALAASKSAELEARAEVVAWEDAASENVRQAHQRRHA